VLLGRSLQPLLELPIDTSLISLTCQSVAPVDDVNAKTSDGGFVFIQAKRTLSLSAGPKSAFASALDQFVRQHKVCAGATVDAEWARPLNRSRDRLVLATRSASSSKITEVLPRLLRGFRDRDEARSLSHVATSAGERAVAKTAEIALRRSCRRAYGRPPSASLLAELLRLMWVQELDVESVKRDYQHALEHLRVGVLADPSQAGVAWAELFKLCARLRADRSGATQLSLLRNLAAAGIRLAALPDYRADIKALKDWTVARLKRASRFTQLLEARPELTMERAVWGDFQQAAAQESLLLVGRPGNWRCR
jgi:hypothetical protein